MQRPKLKEKYHVEYLGPECAFLISERDQFVLEGSDLVRMLPLFDGSRTADQIYEIACTEIPPDRVSAAFEVLLQDEHLAEFDPHTPPAAAAYWSEFGADTSHIPEILSRARVQLTVLGIDDVTPFVNRLRGCGVEFDPNGELHIAIVDDYGHPQLAELNRHCLERSLPLLLIKPVGVRQWIGPLILPGQTACWQCLETRLRDNRVVEAFIEKETGRPGPVFAPRSLNRLGEDQAYGTAATQLLRWLVTGSNPQIESRFLVIDDVAFDFAFHEIVKLPDCSACGDGQETNRGGKPIELGDPRTYDEVGSGYRSEAPEITYERLQHHISPYSGIVSHVEKGRWFGHGPIRTYVAGHNFALSTNDLWFLKDGLRTHSSGKGWTDAQAKTSALCEAIERHSGVYRGSERQTVNSLHDLGDSAVDPRSAMLYSDQQYVDRDEWMARRSRFQVVPEPFDPEATISWSPTWSLTREEQRYLPTSYLYYNYRRDGEPFFCWADSNGAAAGRTLAEAMLQGLFELIERDAICLWWYNRLCLPSVDLDSFGDDRIVKMRDFYDNIGREVWVLDLTADLNVPVFVAISRRVDGPTEDIMMGFGAHLDPRTAMTRALTELNQFMPALLEIDADGNTNYAMGDKDALTWWSTATLENQRYLSPPPSVPQRMASDFASIDTRNVNEMMRTVIDRVEGTGLEVLVLDQTRPAVDLAVVKMIVPGLRHFWARYAPGRLYDVPVELGLLTKATPESELNPVAMFL